MTIEEIKERLSFEIQFTASIKQKNWTIDYQKGYEDGLRRAFELTDPKN